MRICGRLICVALYGSLLTHAAWSQNRSIREGGDVVSQPLAGVAKPKTDVPSRSFELGWIKVCSHDRFASYCYISNECTPGAGENFLTLAVYYSEYYGKYEIRLQLPTGLKTQLGFRLRVSDVRQIQGSFVVCEEYGCFGAAQLADNDITELQTASEITIRSWKAGGADEEVNFTVPFDGFRAAFVGPETDPKLLERWREEKAKSLESRGPSRRERLP